MISENVLALAERTRKKSSPGKFYLKGINFRKFCEFLPKLQNLILAKIMKISKFPKFFSSKIQFSQLFIHSRLSNSSKSVDQECKLSRGC